MPQDTPTCPLCERTGSTTRIYQHLQTTHRKSELSRRLLEEVEGESKELLGAEIQASHTYSTPVPGE
jgi:hypothetical protein